MKSAELHSSKGDAKHDAAMNYVDAANCFKKVAPQAAIDCMLKAVDIYTDMVTSSNRLTHKYKWKCNTMPLGRSP